MGKIKIVVATHGKFGEELIKSAEMIVGQMSDVYSISLTADKSFEDFLTEANNILSNLEGPIISLVDLHGGTPGNAMTVLSKRYNNQVITGVNLPMLIDLYLKSSTIESVEALADGCLATLVESGVHTNKLLV